MRHTFAAAFGLTTALLTGFTVLVSGVLAAKNLTDTDTITRLERELRDQKRWNDMLSAKLDN